MTALARSGDPRAVELLIDVLDADDGTVGWAAAEGLKALGTPEALAAAEEWERDQPIK